MKMKKKNTSILRNKKYKEIDLHGMTRTESEERVKTMLGSYKAQGIQKVKIICGIGHHSEQGPVLIKHIEQFLNRNRGMFSSFSIDRNNNIIITMR